MTLSDWLVRIEAVHSRDIELGLDRVRTVWLRLGAPSIGAQVITVAGTNGKGSTVAFLDAITRAHGWRVGRYTSPHVHRFNERIAINGIDVVDDALVSAFERIERARGDVLLTFFEYTTLAAFLLFADASLDLAVLEVGLGGRLDAVNLIDADVAVVTTIALDHQDWLGPNRERIGFEKAGVFREGAAAVIGEMDPPRTVLAHAEAIGARTVRRGFDYDVARHGDTWSGRWFALTMNDLPRPGMVADIQIDNAAAAIAALVSLPRAIAFDRGWLEHALRTARAPARLEHHVIDGKSVWFDVGHNPQAAESLARWLSATPIDGRTLAVFSLLADKDLAGVVLPLASCVDHWFVCGLDLESTRGRTGVALAAKLSELIHADSIKPFDRPEKAFAAACATANPADRLVVFGSFYLVDRLHS